MQILQSIDGNRRIDKIPEEQNKVEHTLKITFRSFYNDVTGFSHSLYEKGVVRPISFFCNEVVFALAKQIAYYAELFFTECLKKRVIRPLADALYAFIQGIHRYLFVPIAQKIQQIMRGIFIEAPKWFFSRLVLPVCRTIKTVATTKVFPFLSKIVVQAAQLLYNGLKTISSAFYNRIIIASCVKTVQVAKFCFTVLYQNILLDTLFPFFLQLPDSLPKYIQEVSSKMKKMYSGVESAFVATRQFIMKEKVQNSLKWIGAVGRKSIDQGVVPLLTYSKRKIEALYGLFTSYVLQPIVTGGVKKTKEVVEKLRSVSQKDIEKALEKVAISCGLFYHTKCMPIVQKFNEGVAKPVVQKIKAFVGAVLHKGAAYFVQKIVVPLSEMVASFVSSVIEKIVRLVKSTFIAVKVFSELVKEEVFSLKERLEKKVTLFKKRLLEIFRKRRILFSE